MARKIAQNGTLEQAMALLIQNQAAFLALQNDFSVRFAQALSRFDRMEADLEQIKAILHRHEQILNGLSEAIRRKIGFKSR